MSKKPRKIAKKKSFKCFNRFTWSLSEQLPVEVHRGGVSVERVSRVRVGEGLRQKRLEDVRQVVQGGPSLKLNKNIYFKQ